MLLRPRQLAPIVVALAVLAAIGAMSATAFAQSSPSPSPSPTATGTTTPPAALTVNTGNGEQGYDVDLFLPAAVTVKTGTTVTWAPTGAWPEPHTVTFGQPQGNPTTPLNLPASGPVMFDGTQAFSSGTITATDEGFPPFAKSFSVTFTKAGTFNYGCAYHPTMKGTVTVVDSGTVDTQSAVSARGQAEYQPALAGLKAAAAGVPAASVTSNANGTKNYSLAVGADTQQGAAVQFFPATVNVSVGDSVTWVNSTQTPHTVTFHPELFQGDPFAPPPAPPSPYDGSGLANSGIIGFNPLGQPVPKSFTLTFGKPGTYTYECLLHDAEGMKGTVNVAAVAAPTPAPLPPATGTGTALEGPVPGRIAGAGLLMGVAVLLLGVAASRRRTARR